MSILDTQFFLEVDLLRGQAMELAYRMSTYLGGRGEGIFQARWRGGQGIFQIGWREGEPFFQGNILYIRENEHDTLHIGARGHIMPNSSENHVK